jgi:biopolymer transport protein ExbD
MSVRLDHGEVDLAEVHEINVTPFIDVILVLLIIFMIAAPLATVDISVDLPAANAQRQPRPDRPVFLTLKSDLSLALGDETGRARASQERSTRPLRATGRSASFSAPTRQCLTAS